MANRSFCEWALSLEKRPVSLFCKLVVGAAGAVSSYQGLGLSSITKESGDGLYSITLSDQYQALFGINVVGVLGSAVSFAGCYIKETPTSLQTDFKADKTFKVEFLDFAGAAVNPASGTEILFQVYLASSSPNLAIS